MSILILATIAMVLALVNIHALDYDSDTHKFSYQPKLIEFGFDFSSKRITMSEQGNPLFILTICCAGLAILLSPFAYFKEREGGLCLIVAGIGITAIIWQLIVLVAVIGIIIGICLALWDQSL